jgi:ribonucleotide monophosphatase NagD (HAD superfamily)
MRRLKSSNILVRLVTNESQVTKAMSLEKLESLGYKGVELQHISAPAPLLAQKLLEEGYYPHLLIHPKVIYPIIFI